MVSLKSRSPALNRYHTWSVDGLQHGDHIGSQPTLAVARAAHPKQHCSNFFIASLKALFASQAVQKGMEDLWENSTCMFSTLNDGSCVLDGRSKFLCVPCN
mmetsp:Transcript_76365/g.192213  ORF Transcript_76365/g.192213 Transcript_76365/m.192213 type:complete len:101 (+) Transcript_76365:1500-1802(+)